MSQTSYSMSQDAAFAGMLADAGFHNVRSYSAAEAIGLGRGLVMAASESTVRLPYRNYATLTFSADFVASNTINGLFNGVAMAEITYASSHAATFAAVIAAITAIAGVTAVAGTGRSIIVTGDAGNITIASVVVAAGASQATAATVYTSSDVFMGVALASHTLTQDSSGLVQYATYDTVNVLTRGCVYVPVEEAVAVGDSVYLRTITVSSDVRGAFRNDVDSGNALLISNARWVKGASSGGLAILELNLP
jgi:hypothetical protein